ncbi:MAG: DUF1351 domain-containing protein [Porticoccus sp.]|nr:DUF1351 domain-containing protein [Porticoccus sp.]
MKTNLIQIESVPARLQVNFDEIKKHLSVELEKYDVVVTADTVKEAKSLATELNATKKVINTRRKEEVATASEPVRQFDDSMKELVSMCETGRQKILGQVERFEDVTRKKALDLLHAHREQMWEQLGVDQEFRKATYDDLATLAAVTGKGALASSAKTKLNDRIGEDKAAQDQTEVRLLVLENQSYKAGLVSPLTRDHIAVFLFSPDEVYQVELDRVLAAEVTRQEESEKILRKKIDEEKPQEEPATAPLDQEAVEVGHTAEVTNIATLQPKAAVEKTNALPLDAGNVRCLISCQFEIQVDRKVPIEAIKKKFMEKMTEAGFTSMVSLSLETEPAAVNQ